MDYDDFSEADDDGWGPVGRNTRVTAASIGGEWFDVPDDAPVIGPGEWLTVAWGPDGAHLTIVTDEGVYDGEMPRSD